MESSSLSALGKWKQKHGFDNIFGSGFGFDNNFTLPLNGGFPGGSEGKASACNAKDLGSIPDSERSPGEGNGNPLQYSCLENAVDGGAW